MTLLAPVLLSRIFGQAQSPQGDALVDTDIFPDLGCFADDHARSVVDNEPPADRGPGMDIDTRDAVGMLGHDPWQHGHIEFEKAVRHPVNHDGIDSRVAEDDFIMALGGRIAFEGGLHVRSQNAADFGYGLQGLQRLGLAGFVALAAGLVVPQAIVPDVMGDLFRKPIV